MSKAAARVEAPLQLLLDIARSYGTPTYAYDIGRLRRQVDHLRLNLPQAVDIFYSLKANPSLGLCELMAKWGFGADVASAGELITALEAGFPPERILVGGPYKSRETHAHLQSMPGGILSVDSLSELQMLAQEKRTYRIILRLRPDFTSSAAVATGPDCRFGISFEDLLHCREYLSSQDIIVAGFHVFSGSQILSAPALVHHLRGALDLSLRTADLLCITPEILNLGGGFGIPYRPNAQNLDLEPIAEELALLLDRASPARIILELGRYVIAQAGWYLTMVVGHQSYRGGHAVVVDGGIHQRSDLCGLGLRTKNLPPLVIGGGEGPLIPTHVLGCLCLPDDILAEASLLPPLSPGDILAFPNAGAYGLSASPALFLGHPAPAEVAFEGKAIKPLRARQTSEALLKGQTRLEPLER